MSGAEVIVANQAEFNRRTMWGYSEAERRAWDRGGNALQDQVLFWGGGRSTVILPSMPDPDHVEDVRRAVGADEIRPVAVPGRGAFVSRDASASPEVMEAVAERFRGRGEKRLLAWGATRSLYHLVDLLRSKGCAFETPELAHRDFLPLSVNLDSKSGARLFLSRHRVAIPRGYLASGRAEAADIARHFAKSGVGAVVKANHGAGGFAVRVFSPSEIMEQADFVERDLEVRSRYDGCWRSELYVVEEMVGDKAGSCRSLTVDCVVLQDGSVRYVGCGCMRIGHRSRYDGVTVGAGAVPEPLSGRCREIGVRIGGMLSSEGYRGWFDADMLTTGEGGLLVNELNLRRTCPAFAMELARRRWGSRWEAMGAVTTVERLHLGKGAAGKGYREVKRVLDDFNARGEAGGIFAVASCVTNIFQGAGVNLGLAVGAPDARAAGAMLAQLADALRMGM